MNSLLTQLREFDALRDLSDEHADRVELRSIQCLKSSFDKKNRLNSLHPAVKNLILKQGIQSLYTHQADAIEQSLQGNNVVLESPTASGKTLSFIVPMLNKLLQEKDSHALMIYPMKALANDQRRQLNDYFIEDIDSWIFDGDTDQEYRRLLKDKPPRILITNPESLHLSFLGWAHQWNKFLHKIKFIVVDEIHEYRGYFGTNFALLLRRFLLKISKQGACPQLFLSTATCANPLEHAKRLTGGSSFSLISSRDSMRPKREFAFIIPQIPDYQFFEIFQLRIARAALACLAKQLSTIVFCPSRKFAEDVYKRAYRDAEKFGLDPKVIAPYRSGYKADERRKIEDGLRNGEFIIVFSTNALELGIDIGKLDAVILAGFPDNVMSAWQRIGRAGRSWDKTSYVLFYAMNNAVDQFYAGNIDAFLNKPLDEITIGISNKELIDRHVPYLLHETEWALTDNAKEVLGETFCEKAREIIKQNKPISGFKMPYNRLSIRGGSDSIYKLIHNSVEVGSMSDVQVFREAYIGAIYNHFGKSYRVSSHGNKEVYLEGCESHLSAKPSFYTTVQSTDIFNSNRYKETISVFYGKLTIYENFSGYQILDERSGQIVEDVRSEATRRKIFHAFWLRIDDKNVKDGIGALEHIFRIGAMFVLPTDRYDTNTFSKATAGNEIYFYENYAGGIGIAEKAFSVWRNIIEEGISIAKKCPCKNGCPRCIYPPRLKDPSTVKKSDGIKLAKHILSATSDSPEEEFDEISHGWRLMKR